jgi:hypothetical protein
MSNRSPTSNPHHHPEQDAPAAALLAEYALSTACMFGAVLALVLTYKLRSSIEVVVAALLLVWWLTGSSWLAKRPTCAAYYGQ